MNGRNGGQQQPLRSINMNTYGAQQNSRQASRLQNTQKTGLGNGSAGAGWAFGAPSAGGFGGLGGAPGLGAARPGQLSGFAQIMGGGGGQSQIDMNDFPSLSGPARPQQNNGGWGNSNVVRQPHQAQPQQAQAPAPPIRAPSTAPSHQSIEQFDGPRSQQPSTDRSGGADDYQSANGSSSATGDTGRQNGFGSSVLGSPNESNPPVNGQQTQLPIRNSSNSFPPNSQAPIGSGQPTPPSQALSQPPSAPLSNGQTGENGPEPATKKWADMTEGERWGLAGLNAIFEARRQSETGGQIDDTLPPHIRNTAVIMGQDLNTLGMDLDSPEELIHTFSVWPSQHQSDSIFNYRDHHTVPAFQVPQAYTVTNVPPMSTRMGAFSDETLLQIFFQMPRDIMQEAAATELSMRDWRWHKVIRQWLQKDTREANSSSTLPINDLTNGIPIGQPAVRLDERSERGVYIFFDHQNWRRQRREFTLHYDELHVNSHPALGGTNGAAAGAPGGFGGMAAMQGGPVGGQSSGERQNSVIGAT